MKTLFSLIAVLFFSISNQCIALTDAEYKELWNTSDEFAIADMNLADSWKNIYAKYEGQAKKELLSEQRAWLKSGRDAAANTYLRKGWSKAAAYTQAIYDRVNELEERQGTYSGMSPEERLFVSRVTRDMYAEKLQAIRNPPQTICGTITRTDGFALNLSRVRVSDMDDRDLGYFYIDETLRSDEGYSLPCHEILRAGRVMCFDIAKTTANDLGLESKGITEKKLRWVKNCCAPD